ncbi:uncharacterized protein LOC115786407 isoform X1 [Archocentrus centrarchus]|uniref:uncharacterized protein LOC115786407 isoform X1 n=1 Tax=Archocentrus centrarchus TaxID=63155 RepID=UPI0011EA13EC|nr:uncharacterized protein LOC115786407 isoform X1 [Archocentrus centrarchus]
MLVLWITLHFLHQGYMLVPVTTVQLGEPATFICSLFQTEVLPRQVHWYKQTAGDTLKVIVTMQKSKPPKYAPDFPTSRLELNNNSSFSSLTILRTIQEDEGMYHCAVSEWLSNTVWTGTYLLIEGFHQDLTLGKIQGTLNSSVVPRSTVSYGTKQDSHVPGSSTWSYGSSTLIFLLCAVMAISLIVIAILIVAMKKGNTDYCKDVVPLQKPSAIQKNQQNAAGVLFYSTAIFAMMETDKGATKHAKAAERERIYTAVKAFGLDSTE